MLRRGLIAGLAFGLALFGSALAQDAGDQTEQDEAPQASQSERSADDSGDVSKSAGPAPDRQEPTRRDAEPQPAAEPPSEPPDKGDRSILDVLDLIAQTAMALAAIAAAVISAVAVCLVAKTLEATRKAAKHTEGMLKEAKKTTGAAQQAVTVSQAALKLNDRPHLLVCQIAFDPFNSMNPAWFKFVVKNYGGSPAWIIEQDGWLQVSGSPKLLLRKPKVGIWPIAPAGTAIFEIEESSIPEEINSRQFRMNVWEGKVAVFLIGFVVYRDLHGDNHLNRFVYKYDKRTALFEPERTEGDVWVYN